METALVPKSERGQLPAPGHTWIPQRWLRFLVITLLSAFLYASVLADLAKDWWTEPSFSHGLLIPPLACYLAWLKRRSTLSLPAVPDSRGAWTVLGACMVFLVGKLGAEFFLCRISFVILLAGLVLSFWGMQRLRSLGFPFLLLATMIPLPALVYNSLAAPLQLFASDVSTNIARFCGITVYRDGNIIHLAHIALGVEEACSGLNSLSALLIASLLLGFLQCCRLRTRTLLFLFAIPLSIAVNIIRITGTAILADFHEQFALGFYHSFSGWLVFLLGFGLLYSAARLFHHVSD